MIKHKIKIFNIIYDTDDLEIDLPSVLETTIDSNNLDDLDDLISDYISNQTGFCHKGFEYEII